MTTAVVCAKDHDAPHARLAHLAEGDLLRSLHAPSKRGRRAVANYRFLVGREGTALLPVVGVDMRRHERGRQGVSLACGRVS